MKSFWHLVITWLLSFVGSYWRSWSERLTEQTHAWRRIISDADVYNVYKLQGKYQILNTLNEYFKKTYLFVHKIGIQLQTMIIVPSARNLGKYNTCTYTYAIMLLPICVYLDMNFSILYMVPASSNSDDDFFYFLKCGFSTDQLKLH